MLSWEGARAREGLVEEIEGEKTGVCPICFCFFKLDLTVVEYRNSEILASSNKTKRINRTGTGTGISASFNE